MRGASCSDFRNKNKRIAACKAAILNFSLRLFAPTRFARFWSYFQSPDKRRALGKVYIDLVEQMLEFTQRDFTVQIAPFTRIILRLTAVTTVVIFP